MRGLYVLALAQFALIIGLFVRLEGIEDGLAQPPEAVQPMPQLPRSSPVVTASPGGLDEQRLRTIVREELSVLAANAATPAATVPATNMPAADDPEYIRRRDELRQSLDYYFTVGHISDAEMIDLQMQIAGMRPEDQHAMLKLLVSGLNAGAIDGRL